MARWSKPDADDTGSVGRVRARVARSDRTEAAWSAMYGPWSDEWARLFAARDWDALGDRQRERGRFGLLAVPSSRVMADMPSEEAARVLAGAEGSPPPPGPGAGQDVVARWFGA